MLLPSISDGSGTTALYLPLIGSIIALVTIAAVAGWEYLYYKRYRYNRTTDSLDINSGVLSRTSREIPLRRIQNVDIKQNIIHRFMGISELNIETAGGSTSEVNLRYIDEDEALKIQRWIRTNKNREKQETESTERTNDIYEISPRELFYLSFFSIDLRLIAAATFIISFIQPIELEIYRRLGLIIASAVFISLVILLGLLALLWMIGIATTITRYYDFTLQKSATSLEYQRGLLNRYTGSIPMDKIQSITIRENPLMRFFNYASLNVETAGYSPNQSRQQGSEVAVPLATREKVMDISNQIKTIEEGEFTRPPRRARRRYIMRYLLIITFITSILYLSSYLTEYQLLWYLPLLMIPITPAAAHLKWLNRGYIKGEKYIATRNGFWNRKTQLVPYYRLQTLSMSSTILQKRWGISTVTIDTAGSYGFVSNDAKAIDIDTDEADKLRTGIYSCFRDSVSLGRAGYI